MMIIRVSWLVVWCNFYRHLLARESTLATYWDRALSLCGEINIKELTITELHQYYFERQLTSEQLTRCYLERINKINPYLNAVIEVNPDALAIAKNLDQQFAKLTKLTGNLHGVPILIKDNIATNDKMNTTAGSLALLGLHPIDDAQVIKRLRKAGAIILGKANLSEFAGFRASDAPDGWSSRGGQTKNPYVLSESPSGSSSGSAVAVSANLALVALGTETDGSIISPSEKCSVVGLKPTVGSTSEEGVIPLSHSQDSVGAITRSVNDALAVTYTIMEPQYQSLLDSIYEFNPYQPSDFLKSTSKKLRIGVQKDPFFALFKLPFDQILPLNRMLSNLPANIELIDIQLNFTAVSLEKEYNVIGTEFKYYLENHLRTKFKSKSNHPAITSLSDIINFYRTQVKKAVNPYDQYFLELAEKTLGVSNNLQYQRDFQSNKQAATEPIIKAIKKDQLDGFIVPSYSQLRSFTPPAIAGFPIITIPAGAGLNKVPFGISVFGKRYSEPDLIYVASQLSRSYRRSPPKFYA